MSRRFRQWHELHAERAVLRVAETAARGYATLFKKPDRKLLARLKQVGETGVALRAAWEEVLLAGLIPDKRTNSECVKPEAAERFLGFVEGRLGIELPWWWQASVKMAFLGGCERVVPGAVSVGPPKRRTPQQKAQETISKLRKQSVVIPPALLEKHLCQTQLVSFALNPDDCFLAFHYARGLFSYPLACIDRETGKTRWENTVWDSANGPTLAGATGENVTVMVKGNRVFVLGSGSYRFYIEAFDSKTGRNEFRFASWYDAETEVHQVSRR